MKRNMPRWSLALVAILVLGNDGVVRAQAEAKGGAGRNMGLAEPGESGAQAVVHRQAADGSKITQVIDDEKMIRISQRPGKGITVIVVETVRGAEKVNRYAAPTLAVLKARHSRAYEWYEKYARAPERMLNNSATFAQALGAGEQARAQAQAGVQQGGFRQAGRQSTGRGFGGYQPGFGQGNPLQSRYGQTGGQVFRVSGAAQASGARASASGRASASSSSSSSSRSSGSSSSRGSSRGSQRASGSGQGR